MLGSCHALELGFVFGTNHIPGMPQFAGTGPVVERLATEMQDAWLAFARSGDPSCESLGAWPQYDASRRATMILGEKSGAQDAPYEGERRAWEAIPQAFWDRSRILTCDGRDVIECVAAVFFNPKRCAGASRSGLIELLRLQ